MSEEVLRTEREGGVGWLILNRPEKRNALNGELIAAFKTKLRGLAEDEEVRVIALRGEGPDFCAGADLSALREIAETSVLDNLADVERLAELFLLMRQVPKPVVATVHGRALAGGCGLATGCDLVLAAESARFGYPEIRIGFVPAMVMAILRRNLSEKRAFEMVVRGHTLSASEAERIGLINQVYPDAEFLPSSRRYLTELAERSGSAAQLCKRLLYHQDGMTFDAAIRAGADVNVLARMTEDTRAGVAAFLEGQRG